MKELSRLIVEDLKIRNETISFMESCTGGFLANEITNTDGASNVLKVSIVTYSNEYKIKFGVNENTINEYSVYSTQTANEMAKQISDFAKSDWGVGVTGELGDVGATCGRPNIVYYAIYNRNTGEFFSNSIIAKGNDREEKKRFVGECIQEELCKRIKN